MEADQEIFKYFSKNENFLLLFLKQYAIINKLTSREVGIRV